MMSEPTHLAKRPTDTPAEHGNGISQYESQEIISADLFGSAKTVSIRHGADLYTLRITRANKLILTK